MLKRFTVASLLTALCLCMLCPSTPALAEAAPIADAAPAEEALSGPCFGVGRFGIQNTDALRTQDRYALPDLTRMSEEDRAELMDDCQVLRRIDALGVNVEQFQTPELNWKSIYNDVNDALSRELLDRQTELAFEGDSVSGLNAFLAGVESGAKVVVKGNALAMDETLSVPSGVWLVGDGARLIPGGEKLDKAVLLENAVNCGFSGFTIEGGCDYGVYIINSSRFVVADNDISHVGLKGVTMMGGGECFMIRDNHVHENLNGGIFLDGDMHDGVIEGNRVIDNSGARNLTAGLVLSSVEIEDIQTAYNEFRDVHLYDILQSPHNLVVYNNTVARNHSSGIYSDAGYLNYVIANEVMKNEKEGMCFDYGSFGNFIARNNVLNNGGRNRMTDQDLEADFVIGLGRLKDGSSPAKLPGISLDNTAYNTLFCNVVSQNYGSGIKAVRSAYRNVVLCNQVVDNNLGASGQFHFFGIELSTDLNADEEVIGLDFTACYENIIANNMVSGPHYAGAFLGPDAYINDFFDNTFIGCTDWSMECLSEKVNGSLNNLSDVESRGISLTRGDSLSVRVAGK